MTHITYQAAQQRQRVLIATLLLILFLIIVACWIKLNQPPQKVLGAAASDTVQIGAVVPSCILQVKAYPEKRIPPANNWGTILNVAVYTIPAHTLLANFTTTTNNQGIGMVDLCSLGYAPLPGNYDFYLRGYSHLRKLYANINAFSTYATTLDFTTGGKVLLAGETSNIFDNKINSLDISTQIKALYSSDYKNDLNQDSKVNSLDISNTIYNFYKLGD